MSELMEKHRTLVLGIILPLVIIVAVVAVVKSRQKGSGGEAKVTRVQLVAGEGISKRIPDLDKWVEVTLPLTMSEGDYITTGTDSKNIILINDDGSIRMDKTTSLKFESKQIDNHGTLKLKFILSTGRVWVNEGASAMISMECKYADVQPQQISAAYEAYTVMDEQTLESTDTVNAWRGALKATHVNDRTKTIDIAEGQCIYVGEEKISTPISIDTSKLTDWQKWNREILDMKAELAKIAAEAKTPETTPSPAASATTGTVFTATGAPIVTSPVVATPTTAEVPQPKASAPKTPGVGQPKAPALPSGAQPKQPSVPAVSQPTQPSVRQPDAANQPPANFNPPPPPGSSPGAPAKRPPSDNFNPKAVGQPEGPKPTRPPNDNFNPDAGKQPPGGQPGQGSPTGPGKPGQPGPGGPQGPGAQPGQHGTGGPSHTPAPPYRPPFPPKK
jgi:hypothetical protein